MHRYCCQQHRRNKNVKKTKADRNQDNRFLEMTLKECIVYTKEFKATGLMCGFTPKLQGMYLRNGIANSQCKSIFLYAADNVIMTSYL